MRERHSNCSQAYVCKQIAKRVHSCQRNQDFHLQGKGRKAISQKICTVFTYTYVPVYLPVAEIKPFAFVMHCAQ